jgi:hypothetical protein
MTKCVKIACHETVVVVVVLSVLVNLVFIVFICNAIALVFLAASTKC